MNNNNKTTSLETAQKRNEEAKPAISFMFQTANSAVDVMSSLSRSINGAEALCQPTVTATPCT